VLPYDGFMALMGEWIDRPEESVRGCERAVDAQSRIVAAVQVALHRSPVEANVAIVAHGAVGSLLLMHLRREPIGPALLVAGQGFYFAFERESGNVLSGWVPIEHDVPLS
jgi:broad specificity phosphatase PhoE